MPESSTGHDEPEPLRRKHQGGRYGYVNRKGEWVIPPKYRRANPFRAEYALVDKAVDPDGKELWCVVDRTGTELYLLPDRISIASRYVSEGCVPFGDGGKFGLMRITGEILIPPQYDLVCDVSEGTARVAAINSEKKRCNRGASREVDSHEYWVNQLLVDAKAWGDWGLVDTTGNVIVPLHYDWIGGFSEGLAAIKHDGAYGYIDLAGAERIPPQFESVTVFLGGHALVKIKNGWGVIDTCGDFVLQPEFEYLAGDPAHFADDPVDMPFGTWFYEGKISARANGKWGFLDESGNWVIDPEYDAVSHFSEGRAKVMRIVRGGHDDFAADCRHFARTFEDPDGKIARLTERLIEQFDERFGEEHGYERWRVIDTLGNEIDP